MSFNKIARLARRRSRGSYKLSGAAKRNGKLRVLLRKSNRHIYVQLVDDLLGNVITGASTLSKEVIGDGIGANQSSAKMLGHIFADKIISMQREFVFDRGGYRYTGVVKELADAMREKGINF